ncbi:MAG: glycosyltransferase family 39 protein [Candidatus Eisenbacteria bacterium]|uniref:Glycosyltransferase family 39 protein n=1 Tax=Eiseniibacteriota bacterium TaxID=2212470 RepID=A0A933W7P1_UNCEI|nr:glycosyltransferase family 39 protein [Candidatus Eisenbacteria bacterium]
MNTPSSRGLPRPLLAVLAASFAFSLLLALAFPLIDPDEGRNAEVAREMAANGDVVIPHLAGLPYLDKPPALFAAAAACIRVLGPTPLAARLPAMLASLAALLLLARAARRLEGDTHAVTAVALTASAPLFAVLSAYVIFDMPLAACVTAVWTLLAIEWEHGPSSPRRTAMFAAVTLGVLLKGPVMLAWVLGGSVVSALLARDRAPLRWLAWWPGWMLVFGVAGGWFALALRRHPEYARYAFLEESLERMTSGSFKREQPAWFVPAVLAGGALPWSLATPWWRARGAATSKGSRAALGFLVFAAVFFTVSRSKLVTYLLPAIPAMAWLAAAAWRASGRRVRPLAAALALGAIPLALVVGRPLVLRYAESQSGAALARAIRASGGGTVLYERCYSPGTDFLLGRSGIVLAGQGHEITSTYVVRYRESLRERGLWTLRAEDDSTAVLDADVRVQSHHRPGPEPGAGWTRIHEGPRFTAWRRERAPER